MPTLKAKLLIVDDEPSTRELLGQIFREMGHPVQVAEDGFAALEEIRTDVPDILLSDLISVTWASRFSGSEEASGRPAELIVALSSGNDSKFNNADDTT